MASAVPHDQLALKALQAAEKAIPGRALLQPCRIDQLALKALQAAEKSYPLKGTASALPHDQPCLGGFTGCGKKLSLEGYGFTRAALTSLP
jgi:hypothetical protein